MSDPMRDPLDLRLRMARRIGATTRVAVEVDDVLAAISRIEEYDRLRWVVKGAHGALADAGTVVVPGVLDGDIAPAIRQLARERDEARAERGVLVAGLRRLLDAWDRAESGRGCYSCAAGHDCRCELDREISGGCTCGRVELDAAAEIARATLAAAKGE